jgi:hypothetical protein
VILRAAFIIPPSYHTQDRLGANREGRHGSLCVREDAEWHAEAAKEIPAGDVLIVADDAHRFEFLDKLLLLARNLKQRQKVKVLLGTCPSGLGQIDATLSVRFGAAELSRFPQLKRIPQQGVRELAVEVLGAAHAQHAAALADYFRFPPSSGLNGLEFR